MNSPANQDPFFTRAILAILDKATTKGDLTMLISRHLVTAGGGLLAGHGILSGDTKEIVFGVGFALIVAIWSWAVRVLHLDEQTMMSLTKSDLFRSAIAALSSQAVTALSAALAVDANNPTLLVAALINLGLSKLDVHHKLAFVGARDAVKAFSVLGSLFSVCSCAALKDLAAANEPMIEEVIVYGVRAGVKAGFKKLDGPVLRSSKSEGGKQPRDVTPQAGISMGAPECLTTINPRGLCVGNPASRKPNQRTAQPLLQAPQARQLVLMRNADPAALSFQPITPRLQLPRYGNTVAARLALKTAN